MSGSASVRRTNQVRLHLWPKIFMNASGRATDDYRNTSALKSHDILFSYIRAIHELSILMYLLANSSSLLMTSLNKSFDELTFV